MTSPRLAVLSAALAAFVAAGCSAVADGPADRRAAAAEAAYPPTGRLIEVEGLRIHAHIEGQPAGRAQDVILIHGASGSTRDFTQGLSARLGREFRVIAFDRPGLGWSQDAGEAGLTPEGQARILAAAARSLGVRRPVIVGHSYGGAVALAWALEAPRETGAVVVLSGATMPWPGGLGLWYALTASRFGQSTVLPFAAAYAPEGAAARAVAAIFAPERVPEGYVEGVGAGLSLRRQTLAVNARQVNALRPSLVAMSARYGSLDLPVEVLHGTRDRIVPVEIHAKPLFAALPRARLTLIEGAGHMPHHTRKDEVIAAIRRAAEAARR
ncbi:MAG: alpha/beta hydrolase [Alphaproteobacteria bacterium]|nr:alpha/beta hydrolase [Alphaproteobacteria bacterium]